MLDSLEQRQDIDRWYVDMNAPDHMLEIETQKLSAQQVKHLVREAGFEAGFTRAPEAR